MATVTTDERARRRQRDDGDPDATVHVAVPSRDQSTAYHSDPDCRGLQSADTRGVRRHEAQTRGRYPCRRCVLGGADTVNTGLSIPAVMEQPSIQTVEELRTAVAALRKDALYERYWRDMQTIREIAADVDLKRSVVRDRLITCGIPRRVSGWRPENRVSPFAGFYADSDDAPSPGGDP